MAGQAAITIYTSAMCGFCHAAKDLLRRRELDFTEIDVTGDPEGRREMTERSGGRRTVPQIFIGDRPIGGFTDLHALERSGDLDRLLDSAA